MLSGKKPENFYSFDEARRRRQVLIHMPRQCLEAGRLQGSRLMGKSPGGFSHYDVKPVLR